MHLASAFPFPSFLRTAAPSMRSVAILFHLFYFHFLQYIFVNSIEPLYRSTQTYTPTKPRIHPGAFTKQNLRRARQKNLRNIFALTPRSTEEFFAGACGYFARAIGIPREMESIYNFANGHSVLPLATLLYHFPQRVYLFIKTRSLLYNV